MRLGGLWLVLHQHVKVAPTQTVSEQSVGLGYEPTRAEKRDVLVKQTC